MRRLVKFRGGSLGKGPRGPAYLEVVVGDKPNPIKGVDFLPDPPPMTCSIVKIHEGRLTMNDVRAKKNLLMFDVAGLVSDQDLNTK